MPPLMQLPAYQTPNALMNFAPVSEGIDSYRKGQEDVRRFGVAQQAGNALMSKDYSGAMATALQGDRPDLAGLAMHAQQNDQQSQLKDLEIKKAKIDGIGRMAQAALQEQDPAKRAAMQQHIISQHPDPDILQKFPIYGTPQGLTMLAAESGHALNALDEQMKRAQIALAQAHAGYYRGATEAQRAKAGAYGQPNAQEPLDGMGMDREGNVVPIQPRPMAAPKQQAAPAAPWTLPSATQMAQGGIVGAQRLVPNQLMAPDNIPVPASMTEGRGFADPAMQPDEATSRFAAPGMAESRVLGVSSSAPDSSTTRRMVGPTGRINTSVPGIVVDSKGKTDRMASANLAGQDALDETPDDQRKRLADYLQKRQMNEYVFGKAPSGFRRGDSGELIDEKDESKKMVAAARASPMMQDIEVAKKVLVDGKSSMLGRAIALTPYLRMAAPEYRGAIENLNHTIATLTALVEGNRHANAQDVRFLKFFSIEKDDSTEDVGRKLDQVNRIYKTYVGDTEGARAGTLYKSATQKAAEKINGGPLQDYQPKPGGALNQKGVPAGNYRFDPATGSMVPQ